MYIENLIPTLDYLVSNYLIIIVKVFVVVMKDTVL